MMYNKPTSEVHHMAEEMMEWCEGKISDYKNAEALATSRSWSTRREKFYNI